MRFKSTNHFLNYLFENEECIETDLGSTWCPEDETKGFTEDFMKKVIRKDENNKEYILQDEETMQALHYSSKEQLKNVLDLMQPKSLFKKPIEFKAENTDILRKYQGSSFMPSYIENLIRRRENPPLEADPAYVEKRRTDDPKYRKEPRLPLVEYFWR